MSRFKLTTPSQRTLAQEEELARRAWANRRDAEGQGVLTELPVQLADSRRLMKFPSAGAGSAEDA
jgi:hypothetical protein